MNHLSKALSYLSLVTLSLLPAMTIFSSCSDDEPSETPLPPTENVTMRNALDCYYFLPIYKDYGNYYFELASGEVGYVGIRPYPLNPGDYILCLDMNAPLDPDHHNPTLPAATYNPTLSGADDHDYTFTLSNTMAVYNQEATDDGQYRIKYILFSDGKVNVEHNSDGTYRLTCDFTEKDTGKPWHFTYEGELPFEDQSAIEDEDWWGFEGDTDFTAQKANIHYYDDSETLGVDNYIIRLFESNMTTSDGTHQNDVGNKAQISLYATHGGGLAGTYIVNESSAPGSAQPGKRFASMASGSFIERVREDYSVRYALMTEGTITITQASEEIYNVTIDAKTPEGASVKVTYRGKIEDITDNAPVASTLTADVNFTPTECTSADFYGDYFGNGTVNYGMSLANDTELIVFDFIAASGDANELPTGTFTVSSSEEAGSLAPGYIDGGSIIPTAYVVYDETATDATGYAPVAGGSLTISKSGSLYTFTFDLLDDANPAHKIYGTVTCTVPTLTDHTKQSTAALRRVKANMVRSIKELAR